MLVTTYINFSAAFDMTVSFTHVKLADSKYLKLFPLSTCSEVCSIILQKASQEETVLLYNGWEISSSGRSLLRRFSLSFKTYHFGEVSNRFLGYHQPLFNAKA